MHRWIGALAAALALAGSASAETSFRGAALGMPLEAWKAQAPPEQLFHPAHPMCSDQKPDALWVERNDADRAAGVVVCIYEDNRPYGGRTGMRVGPYEITGATYRFVQGRLYSVQVVAESDAFDLVTAAIRAKYGPPASTANGAARNGLGVSIPQTTLIWVNGDDQILVKSPALRAGRMLVLYLRRPLAAVVHANGNPADQAF